MEMETRRGRQGRTCRDRDRDGDGDVEMEMETRRWRQELRRSDRYGDAEMFLITCFKPV